MTEDSYSIPLSPETLKLLQEQKEEFRRVFGRNPRSEDPVIWKVGEDGEPRAWTEAEWDEMVATLNEMHGFDIEELIEVRRRALGYLPWRCPTCGADVDPDTNFCAGCGTYDYRTDLEGSEQVGRNALCPCGSMRKYKKCCGA